MQPVLWSRDHGLKTRVHPSSFFSRSRSRDLKPQVSVLVSRPKKGLDNNTAYFSTLGWVVAQLSPKPSLWGLLVNWFPASSQLPSQPQKFKKWLTFGRIADARTVTIQIPCLLTDHIKALSCAFKIHVNIIWVSGGYFLLSQQLWLTDQSDGLLGQCTRILGARRHPRDWLVTARREYGHSCSDKSNLHRKSKPSNVGQQTTYLGHLFLYIMKLSALTLLPGEQEGRPVGE